LQDDAGKQGNEYSRHVASDGGYDPRGMLSMYFQETIFLQLRRGSPYGVKFILISDMYKVLVKNRRITSRWVKMEEE
jgi:hypothetical protein